METVCFSKLVFFGFVGLIFFLAGVAIFLFWTKHDLKDKVERVGKVADSQIGKLGVEYYNTQNIFFKALLGALRSSREICQNPELIMQVSRAIGKLEERTKNDERDFSSIFEEFCAEINLPQAKWGDSYFSSLSQIPLSFIEIENNMNRLRKWKISFIEWQEVFFRISSISKEVKELKEDLEVFVEKQKREIEFSKSEN